MLNSVALVNPHQQIVLYFKSIILIFNLANLFSEINGRLVVKRNANFKIIFLNIFVYVFEFGFSSHKINDDNEYTNLACTKKMALYKAK